MKRLKVGQSRAWNYFFDVKDIRGNTIRDYEFCRLCLESDKSKVGGSIKQCGNPSSAQKSHLSDK
jgi:hypothetical protein